MVFIRPLAGLRPLALALACGLAGCGAGSASAPVAPTPSTQQPLRTPAFVNGHYENPGFQKRPFDLIRYSLNREPGVWQRPSTQALGAAPPAEVGVGQLRVTLISHATALLQFDGLNVLTDPVYSERASPLQWAGPKRFIPAMIAFAALPKIDAVVISHNHYDHLDLPTLQRLAQAFNPVFIVGERQGALLKNAGLARVVELNWEGEYRLDATHRVYGAPAQHWTGRSLGDRNESLWMSYVFESRNGPIYFAGDTGFGRQFAQAQERFGDFRFALLPIGAYKPRWLTEFQHMSPCQALRAHRVLRARQSVAIHYGTFELSDDGQTEPVEELTRCIAQEAAPAEAAPFTAPPFGSGYDVP